jgi:hypothetical protein
MADTANRGPAAHRDRPQAMSSDQAGPPGRSERGGRPEPRSQAGEDEPPPDDGLSSSIALLLDKLHDAAAAHDRDLSHARSGLSQWSAGPAPAVTPNAPGS